MEVILGQTCISKAFSEIYFCDQNTIQNEFFFSYLRTDPKWILRMNSPFPTYIQDSYLWEMGQQNNTEV